ncbi:DENN domain-containing protein 10-like [Haliotis cracherodii]|uniref:DENN domain-containing protein 10-like n=1 Tax=Haliotis cracherodii TaxID=6455 RepID=UPI0039E9FBE3
MAALCDLLSAGIIEKDRNGDVLWTWSYPSASPDQREMLLHKCGLSSGLLQPLSFIFYQWQQRWYYLLHTDISEEPALPKVTNVSLVLVTRDFNPEKYERLGEILSKLYREKGSPSAMLEAYMGVVTRGVCATDDNGKFSVKDFGNRKAYAKSNVKNVVQTLGLETILLYTALMLKKRIAIYFPPHSLADLLVFTRSLPALVWHRQNWSIVYPYVSLTSIELEGLKAVSHYVAGFTEAEVEGRPDLYDVFVNGPSGQITVASHAKDALAMGKLHKDIALLMVQTVESADTTDEDMIKELAGKTKELLSNLRSLASDEGDGRLTLTLDNLKQRKMPPATENFLFSLAACEGLVKF